LLRESSLIVAADSSAWAAMLRYQQQSLVEQLRNRRHLTDLRRLVIKVAPPEVSRAASARERSFHISTQAKQLLADAAEHIEDPGLQAALRRLSRRPDR
jgi:hypothetical protein